MTALYIICAVLLLLTLLLALPVGGEAEYSEEGFRLWLRIGAIRKRVDLAPKNEDKEKPRGEKKDKKPKKEKKKKSGEKASLGEKLGGGLENFRELLPIITQTLGKLKRSLIIKKLELSFCAAAPDPARAALSFGAASAGAGMVVPFLQSNFRIKSMDVRNSVDFTASKSRVYAHADIRIRVGAALAIAISAGVRYMKLSGTKQ